MAGTFLRAEQSTLTGGQRAAAILLTGFGDATNSAYVERPGTYEYAAGYANYSGLNFRSPQTGRSFVAGVDTGNYSLMANSKYYTRSGGVSGIHQAAVLTSPMNLNLYGYPFTFTSYALSCLDSQTYDSRTDGSLVLPVPAGFTQEFSRMKFLCSGGLDNAQLPSTSVTKHMAYWDVNIIPQSIQFAPQTNENCSTAPRFLVLGVQTTLPFIPQSIHATLGFKPNGNLVTAADAVEGVNSRFALPGLLNLQGSGTSLYPLSTASDGYFNNWENTQNRKPDFSPLRENSARRFLATSKCNCSLPHRKAVETLRSDWRGDGPARTAPARTWAGTRERIITLTQRRSTLSNTDFLPPPATPAATSIFQRSNIIRAHNATGSTSRNLITRWSGIQY